MDQTKRQRTRAGLLLLAAAFLAFQVSPPAAAEAGPLRIAAVQLRLDAGMLRSYAVFEKRIAALVERAAALEPDLIVFPEYTGVFLALIPYAEAWTADGAAGNATVEAVFAAIREREPLIESLTELFLLNSGLAERALQEVFGGLARRHAVPILAGSYFAWEGGPGREARLRNRAVVFGPGGRRLYAQDKVFLTDFESGLLGLEAGSRRSAASFSVAGRELGLTLCRDTYDTGWEAHFTGLDAWIDIKANGAAYDETTRQSFLRALPARIAAAEVPWGLTVCLTGEFLDLFWEGESSLVRKEGGEARFLWRASDPRREEIALLVLAPGGGGLTVP